MMSVKIATSPDIGMNWLARNTACSLMLWCSMMSRKMERLMLKPAKAVVPNMKAERPSAECFLMTMIWSILE